MKTRLALIALAALGITTTAAAQGATPVSDAIRSIEQRSGKHLVAAAEAMPAGKYGYKPTPAQMSFGKVIAHLAQGNDFLCSKIGGIEAPARAKVAEGDAKAKLVAALQQSFEFCNSALAKVNDSDLNAKVKFFGENEVTRAHAMFAAAEDWADHYGQLANYLRLNGLLPPTANEKEE